MYCIVDTVYWSSGTAHCALRMERWTWNTAHCNLHCKLDTVHYTLCTAHCTLYTAHYIVDTAHCRQSISTNCIILLTTHCTAKNTKHAANNMQCKIQKHPNLRFEAYLLLSRLNWIRPSRVPPLYRTTVFWEIDKTYRDMKYKIKIFIYKRSQFPRHLFKMHNIQLCSANIAVRSGACASVCKQSVAFKWLAQ